MKIFTYLRTAWHTFWMYMLVGPATPEAAEVGLAPRTEVYSDVEVESIQEFLAKHS